jgi:hypothetical protein
MAAAGARHCQAQGDRRPARSIVGGGTARLRIGQRRLNSEGEQAHRRGQRGQGTQRAVRAAAYGGDAVGRASMVGATWPMHSRLVLHIRLYLLLPPVFLRLDWFSWCFHRLDAKPLFKIKVFFQLIRLDLALHIVTRIRYLGFTLKGRRVP